MSESKKKILMLPSWYPTRSNPIGGSFFQEQALALSSRFDIVVAFVEFRIIGPKRLLGRLLRGKSLRPFRDEDEYISPPPCFLFAGYGFSLGWLNRIMCFRFAREAMARLNERRERELYIEAYNYAANELNFKAELLYGMTAQVNAIQVYELGQALGLPVAVAEHVPFSIDAIPLDRRIRLKRALEGADALLAVSHDKARQILMGNIDCEPIVVGNMVDGKAFPLKPERDTRAPFSILIVASYNFYKDFTTFFRSMARLREIATRPFTITIVGIAPSAVQNEWAEGEHEFAMAIAPYGLMDIATIVPAVPRKTMVEYYHRADAFVLTSIQEGFPVSVLEAMACGLPVFSTRCGGVEDIVDDTCGRVFPIRDYLGIAAALNDYIKDRLSFNKAHIRKRVLETYGVEAFTRRMTAAFCDCLAGLER